MQKPLTCRTSVTLTKTNTLQPQQVGVHAMGCEPVPGEAVARLPVRKSVYTACHVLLQVQLLAGVAYSQSNLQAKLLYASACFCYNSWTFDRLNGPNLQLFELHFHVSFVPKASQQPAMLVKPAPPLIVPLPPDLFYPFFTNGAAAQRGGLSAQQWLLLGALLWFSHVAGAIM